MRALLLQKYGSVDNLSLQDIDDPVVGPNEVLVGVSFAGMNFPDVLISKGLYQFKPELPFSPGGEASGTVVQVGSEVEYVKVGDRVIATNAYGAFAEKMLVPASNITLMTHEVPMEKAAALLETYATGLHALRDRGALMAGERVLVLGAAGGTGIAAIQIAKVMGAEVVAAASTPEKLALARDNGADHVINYESDDLKSAMKNLGGVDIVYDPVGGPHSESAFRSLRPGGRHLVIGFTSGSIPAIPWNLPLLKQASIVGVFWGGFWRSDPERSAANNQQLLTWLHQGIIDPQIAEVLPLEQAVEGLQMIENREVKGKLVIRMN